MRQRAHPRCVVKDIREARVSWRNILKGTIAGPGRFVLPYLKHSRGSTAKRFDIRKSDLARIGVVNQTTMLASDTQAIADFLKQTMIEAYGLTGIPTVEEHFADTRRYSFVMPPWTTNPP